MPHSIGRLSGECTHEGGGKQRSSEKLSPRGRGESLQVRWMSRIEHKQHSGDGMEIAGQIELACLSVHTQADRSGEELNQRGSRWRETVSVTDLFISASIDAL